MVFQYFYTFRHVCAVLRDSYTKFELAEFQCFTVRWTAVQRTAPQGSPRTPATRIAATTPGLSSGF